MPDDYEVGYGRPPKHTRFKKGQSGNPKGRPKGSRNFSTDVRETLKEPVSVTKGGKRQTVSTQQAALSRLREKALKGDARSLDRLIELARIYNEEELVEMAKLGSTDAEVLAGYSERLLRRAGRAPSDNDDNNQNGDDDQLR